MDSNKTSPSDATFWTPMRVISSIIVFAVCAIVGVSLFSSNETAPTKNTSVNTNIGNANTHSVRKQPDANPDSEPPSATAPPDPAKLPRMSKTVMDAEIKQINGKTFRLSDYKGKVIVLNLWATWCGPCRMEIPELVKLSEEFKGQDVEIIGLNVSPEQDGAETIREFIDQYKIPYTIGQVDDDLQSIFMSTSGSIPQSFLITRDGKVYIHFKGYSRSLSDSLRKGIKEALNFKS